MSLNVAFQRDQVGFMKSAESWVSNATRVIECGDGLFLVPLSGYHLDDDSLIHRLAKWRDSHQYAYPSTFTVTAEGTKAWLQHQVLGNPDRLLFLIVDRGGIPVGHAGILLRPEVREVEMDNILRGEPTYPGAMTASMLALEEWTYRELGVDSCVLKVLGSNDRAQRFYVGLGYSAESRTPLKRVDGADGSSNLVAAGDGVDDADDSFIAMRKAVTESRPSVKRVLTAGPSIGPRERSYCAEAVAKGWNDKHSEYLNRFEQRFAEYVGAEFAIATSSCTGALHLSLLALGIGPGDEVVVPEITWVATAAAVAYVGATPVFCDVDPETWCMSPTSFEECITPRTRAVMPVHVYGFPADMAAIVAISEKHGIRIVEDVAPAIGAKSGGKIVGAFGDFGCFSFQGAKMLVTGEGGMLVTSDARLYERAKKLQDHGRKPGTFWIEELGRKYKMSNQTAALGLAQLERAELQIARKTQIAEWYSSYLADCAEVAMQICSPVGRSIYWMNSIRLLESGITRDELRARLDAKGIDTRPVFPAISSYPIWGREHVPSPTASCVGSTSINLPSGVLLSEKSVERVCVEIKSILAGR